jgi:hypothetical protein
MKRIFYLVLFLLLSFNLYAQKALNTEERFPELKYTNLTGTIYYKTYRQYTGTAFLDDNYRIGRIFLMDGSVIENVKLKLDLFANILIVYQDVKQQLVIVDKDKVNGFELDGPLGIEKFVRLQEIKGKTAGKFGSYLRVLAEGKTSLYKLQFKEQTTLQNPTDLNIYEFSNKAEYHLFIGGEDDKIKLNRATVKKLFPQYKNEVRKYIRQSKIKPGSENGFAKIIEYINILDAEKASAIKPSL